MKPPAFIDGAKVIKWAWSESQPFGVVSNDDGSEREVIYRLAICHYECSKDIYRLSCNKNWQTIQDGIYKEIEYAIAFLPDQYKHAERNWHSVK